MSAARYAIAALLLVVLYAEPVYSQQTPLEREVHNLSWRSHPATGPIASVAQISLPTGIRFLDAAGTRRFLELTDNPPRDNDYTVAPTDVHWFAIFTFDKSGYVRDDEQLDQDALLETLKEQNESGIA